MMGLQQRASLNQAENNANANNPTGLFGNNNTNANKSTGLFGNNANANANKSTGLFGNNANANKPGGLFGVPAAPAAPAIDVV